MVDRLATKVVIHSQVKNWCVYFLPFLKGGEYGQLLEVIEYLVTMKKLKICIVEIITIGFVVETEGISEL